MDSDKQRCAPLSGAARFRESADRRAARFYDRLRAWAGRSDLLCFVWQVLNCRPAVAGSELRLWLVPSATSDGQSYLVDIAARVCTCDGFHFRHACPHLAIADRAARLRVQFSATYGDWKS